MISLVVCIILPLVSPLFQQISPPYHSFHHFFSLFRLFLPWLSLFSFSRFLETISKEILYSKNALWGWISSRLPFGIFWDDFVTTFLTKWSSRMTNLSRKVHVDLMIRCQMSQNICHNFTSGLKPFSNLFQPFAFGFKQFSDPIVCFFSLVFSSCSTYCNILHRSSSVVQSIMLASAFISFFLPVFGNDFKRSSLFKNALRGAGSDRLPS